MPRSNTPSPADPGGRLQSALTQDQIQTLLNVLVEAGHLQTLDNRLRAADQDLADTVRRIQDEPRTKSEAVPSSQKTIEIWNTLWASWADHVAEVGDEARRVRVAPLGGAHRVDADGRLE